MLSPFLFLGPLATSQAAEPKSVNEKKKVTRLCQLQTTLVVPLSPALFSHPNPTHTSAWLHPANAS